MQRSNHDFSITTGRDGSRSFRGQDAHWNFQARNSDRRKHKYSGRGSYQGRGRGRGYQHWNHHENRNEDAEGDVMMGADGDQGSVKRYNPYGARPASRRGRRGNRGSYVKDNRPKNYQQGDRGTARRLGLPLQGDGPRTSWYKVTIPQGKKMDKNELINLLGSKIPGVFRPIQFHCAGDTAMFFLDDRDVADIIKSISRTITLPNSNVKLMINVRPSSPPSTLMDTETKEKLTVVLSARYDPSVRLLDLTALQDDKSLREEGLFLPLNRTVICVTVSSIIQKNIPELAALNLAKNRILSLGLLQEMVSKAPDVTSLNLSSNQVCRIEELDKIKAWKLTELILDGNPLCDKFSSKAEYISAIRKRFPKVIKLDGNDLPPPITFDVSTSKIPPSQGSYFANNEVKDLVVRFLKEYYTLYDSDNRQPLVDAYHENALFSMSASSNPVNEYKQAYLGDYIHESRNSLRIKGDEFTKVRTLDKLLKKGRLQVVTAFTNLPRTTHDANSFVVDVNLLSSTLLSFVVSGLFKESDNKADKPPIRAFSRCFMAVPAGNGILITNDILTITNATSEQQQAAFKSTGPTPSSSPVSSNPPALTPPGPSTSAATSPAAALSPQQQLESLSPERQQMVVSFSQHSTMNFIFSLRCLDDNAWDFDKAAKMFLQLHGEGKIPQEAFIK